MTVLDAIIQGIIQGLTEFLPVSSSGHLTVYQHIFVAGDSGDNLAFSALLHIGTLLAVCIVYHRLIGRLIIELFTMIRDVFTGRFSWKGMNTERRMLVMMIVSLLMLVPLVLPVFSGNSLQDLAEGITSGDNIIIVGISFLLTAALLLTAFILSKRKKATKADAEVKDAVVIGLAQDIAALMPGVSRSGSTIATGLICGLEREYMVRYSFIMSVPTILAANVLLTVKDAVEMGGEALAVPVIPAVVGVIVSALFGVLAIRLIEWIIRKDYYNYFGYYCAAVGALVIALGIWESASGTTLSQLIG